MKVTRELYQREQTKERSCDGKVRYGHSQTAWNAIKAMRAKGSDGLEPYLCPFCDGYHIGHSNTGIRLTFKPE